MAGVVAGVVAALGVTQFLRGLIWGIEPNDSLTMAGASIFLCMVAAIACLVPARRAAKVDPMVALRAE